MKDQKNPPSDFTELRRRAEQRLQTQTIDPEALSPEECIRLVHELQVHQMELEMQNEELRQAQARLAESKEKYADLYDFAPLGYLSRPPCGTRPKPRRNRAKLRVPSRTDDPLRSALWGYLAPPPGGTKTSRLSTPSEAHIRSQR